MDLLLDLLLELLLELLLVLLLLLLPHVLYPVHLGGRSAPPRLPFEGSHTCTRGGRPRALLAGPAFRSLVRPAAFDWLKNMRSAGCVALRLRFFARTWPLGLDFARSDGPRAPICPA